MNGVTGALCRDVRQLLDSLIAHHRLLDFVARGGVVVSTHITTE
jgi:hypothetical protein